MTRAEIIQTAHAEVAAGEKRLGRLFTRGELKSVADELESVARELRYIAHNERPAEPLTPSSEDLCRAMKEVTP